MSGLHSGAHSGVEAERRRATQVHIRSQVIRHLLEHPEVSPDELVEVWLDLAARAKARRRSTATGKGAR